MASPSGGQFPTDHTEVFPTAHNELPDIIRDVKDLKNVYVLEVVMFCYVCLQKQTKLCCPRLIHS